MTEQTDQSNDCPREIAIVVHQQHAAVAGAFGTGAFL